MTPSAHPKKSTYRSDIQGLRAIAVGVVVAFHAGLPLPGGFTGVDVFFVISGFVITAKLLRDYASSGRISLFSFWRQRFQRLTPALAVLVSVVLTAGAFILFPDQQERAVATGVGAMLLVANIVIARTTGGYFDGPAEANPLLNTWSLSVEEQFYLVFPAVVLVALLIARRSAGSRRVLALALGIVFVGSFALAVYGTLGKSGGPELTWLNFYSPVGRAWEFVAGALVALLPTRQVSARPWLWSSSAWLALLVIVAATVWVNSEIPWPGMWTLAPVLATAWILYVGGLHTSGSAQRFLSARGMVKVGDWSYSIYLWHWPFISFALYLGLTNTPWLVVVAVASLLPAIASYYWVETPLRILRVSRPSRMLALVLAVVGVPLVIAATLGHVLPPTSKYQGDLGAANYLTYIDQHSSPCEGALGDLPWDRCRQSQPQSPIDTFVIGDSHAEHLYPGLIDAIPDSNIAYAYLADWPLGAEARSTAVFDALSADPSIRSVVINARWSDNLYGEQEVAARVRQLADSGKVVFLGNDGPFFSFHARECKFDRPLFFNDRCDESSEGFMALREANEPKLQAMVSGINSAHILDTSGVWCTEGSCSMLNGGDLLFADQGHLNVLGSRFLANHLLAADATFASALRRAD